jgi:hypothetical protein
MKVEQLTLIARPGERARRRGLRAVVLAPTVADRCRDCGEQPRMSMWRVCERCWRLNRARDTERELEMAA